MELRQCGRDTTGTLELAGKMNRRKPGSWMTLLSHSNQRPSAWGHFVIATQFLCTLAPLMEPKMAGKDGLLMHVVCLSMLAAKHLTC